MLVRSLITVQEKQVKTKLPVIVYTLFQTRRIPRMMSHFSNSIGRQTSFNRIHVLTAGAGKAFRAITHCHVRPFFHQRIKAVASIQTIGFPNIFLKGTASGYFCAKEKDYFLKRRISMNLVWRCVMDHLFQRRQFFK